MANCGVKRDQRNACIHFRKHCQVGFFEIIDRRFVGQRLQSCLSNGVGFDVRFGRATISGVGKESWFAAHEYKAVFPKISQNLPESC